MVVETERVSAAELKIPGSTVKARLELGERERDGEASTPVSAKVMPGNKFGNTRKDSKYKIQDAILAYAAALNREAWWVR